jgi:hypothetical protein|tara:strand:+ start:11326 stop:11490 length:165 start_codon:yes stop_codon:yes gene_type:complete
MDLDTLKSAVVGGGSMTIQCISILPDIVRLGVGITTIVYFVFKIALIRKELAKK